MADATQRAAMQAERKALETYLKECDDFAIVPDVGGAWAAAWRAARAENTTPTLREAAERLMHRSIEDRRTLAHNGGGCYDENTDPLIVFMRAALAEQAPHPSYPHMTQPYTLEEIRARIASHDYSAELLLQHAMLLLEAAEKAEPVALTRERNARRAAQIENVELKERLARARIDLMRELREQGWTPAPARQEPPADWSVFNTGAEVAGGLTYAEALDYLTPARLERGWSAVCVVNKDNIPAAPAEGGANG